MKIQADGDEKISVTLTKKDMTELDITYDELDYANIETRRVIWTILDEAKKLLGKTVSTDNRLLIQASPSADGGCLLQFTQLPEPADTIKRRLIMKKEAEPVLLHALDLNAHIECRKRLTALSHLCVKFEHYVCNGEYYTLLHPMPACDDKLIFALCEFGNALVSPKALIGEIYEYGRQLS